VTDWIRKLSRGEDIHQRTSGSGHLADDRLPILIASALEELPFQSVRSLPSAIKYTLTTVWRYVHSSGYVVRHLHVVPHTLSPDQKAARVASTIKLKKF
jgi:hypothetical protein